MRYLDVCSGYSAATVAFHDFGWECAGYAEIDPFAAAIIAAHHGGTMPMRMPDPDQAGLEAKERKRRATAIRNLPHFHWGDRIPNFGDFTTIGEDDVGPVDLLIGGTPCQSFSQAGKRLGLDDPRGNLTLEFLALARRVRPRWLGWENVPGFLSHDGGRTAGTFFRFLGELGYGWAYRILDAQFIRVDGLERAVPQRRRRVIVVGCLGNATAAAAVLFDRESLRGNPQPRRRSVEDVAPTIRASAGKRGGVQDEASAEGLVPEASYIARDVAATLDANFGRLQGCSGQDAGHGHSHLVVARMLSFGEYVEDDVAGTIKARDRAGRETDLVLQPVSGPLRAGGAEAGWTSDLDSATFIPVPPVANTLSAQRARTPCGDGTEGTLIPVVVPFDTTQITNIHNGSNPQPGDPCHALAASGHPPTIAFTCKDSGQDATQDVAPTLRSMNFDASHANGGGQIAIAFKPSHYTRDKDGSPRTVAPPLTADTDKGDQDTVVLVREAIAFDSGQDPVSDDSVAGALKAGRSQAQAICIHADAIGRDGKAQVDSPDAEGRMRKRDAGLGITEGASFNLTTGAPHAIAFQERGRPEGRAIEWQEETAYALLSPSDGGRRSEMNICDGWKVRRLTEVECERLQGVPDFYTHIELKKRQRTIVPHDLEAYWRDQRPELTLEQLQHLCAGSPRYRVLGNSYAVNFIRWVGWGIVMVDKAVFG